MSAEKIKGTFLWKWLKRKFKSFFYKPNKEYPVWDVRTDKEMHRIIKKRYIFSFFHLERFDQEMLFLKKLNNIHLGKRVFIVCTGQSLQIQDLEKLGSEFTIGVNSLISCYGLTSWRPTYYIAIDHYAFGEYLKNNEVYGGKFANEGSFFHYRIETKTKDPKQYRCLVNYINHKNANIEKGKIKLSKKVDVCLYEGFTVTVSAIQLAIFMGFSEIYLIGADCDYSQKQKHFLEHPMNTNNCSQEEFRKIEKLSKKGYLAAKALAEKNNVKIFNATRGGKLDIFERKNFEEVLKED